MRIALDAMGGDFAPQAVIEGALLAAEEFASDVQIVLIGQEKVINDLLHTPTFTSGSIEVVHAEEVIGMDEHPTKALSQKNKFEYCCWIWLAESRQSRCFLQCRQHRRYACRRYV